jgi:alcohol dehydrogenase class IV
MSSSLSMGIPGKERAALDAGPTAINCPVADLATAAPVVEEDGLRPITLSQPGRIFFGNGCLPTFVADLETRGLRSVFLVSGSAVLASCGAVLARLEAAGIRLAVYDRINSEPTVKTFEDCLRAAEAETVDGVVGLGGGSALDVAKLVAALLPVSPRQSVREVFGIGLLKGRGKFLACLPTTAGTGSEVSPNAILLDESCELKKGVISPHLVPDVACVDPLLTCSMPPAVTASTGLDALTHCIEAYANKFAHPAADLYALAGIRRIAGNLPLAIKNGQDSTARAEVALGSLYGGMCLGPVNTAAVHALAYPLGSEFHVAHGISNAVLLPHVLRFNLPAARARYADIAVALGAAPGPAPEATAERGIARIEKLMADCPIPRRIRDFEVPQAALPQLAKAAMTVTRLLKNNPRPLTEADALEIYRAAW